MIPYSMYYNMIFVLSGYYSFLIYRCVSNCASILKLDIRSRNSGSFFLLHTRQWYDRVNLTKIRENKHRCFTTQIILRTCFCQTNINQITVLIVRSYENEKDREFLLQCHPSMLMFWTIFKHQSYLPRWSIE